MIRHVSRSAFVVAALLLVLAAGCAGMMTLERRAMQGPTAQEIWTAKVILGTGREPSFDEKNRWDDQMDVSISRYLSQNPQVANAVDVQTFKFLRQVTVGMDQEQVLLLLGPPVAVVRDAPEIEKLARGFWPLVKASNATEAWVYPQGWRLYLKDTRVVDITQYLER